MATGALRSVGSLMSFDDLRRMCNLSGRINLFVVIYNCGPFLELQPKMTL